MPKHMYIITITYMLTVGKHYYSLSTNLLERLNLGLYLTIHYLVFTLRALNITKT